MSNVMDSVDYWLDRCTFNGPVMTDFDNMEFWLRLSLESTVAMAESLAIGDFESYYEAREKGRLHQRRHRNEVMTFYDL